MSTLTSSGSPTAHPQRYHTLPTVTLSQAEQQDRWLKPSELTELLNFFQSGTKLLEIAETLSRHADQIVSAAGNRIFVWGAPMAYLEALPSRLNLPGSNSWAWQRSPSSPMGSALPQRFRYAEPDDRIGFMPQINWIEGLKFAIARDLDPVPDKFSRINVLRYGTRNMRKSMRDIAWFLRYVIYAIVAGDSSILTVNARGLRGVIPEEVTAATVVAIQTLKWKSLSYFKQDPAAQEIIRSSFDRLIAEYQVESPTDQVRQGVSLDQQGLKLPEVYGLTNLRPKYRFTPGMAVTEQQEAIKAAYRQVFERDLTRAYGIHLSDLESQVKSGKISTREFVRRLGKSRLYRQECYEPFTISRVIELAVRNFLGRGLYSIEEFQTYFEVITQGGLAALVDALVDSPEYAQYFGEDTVPYLRGLGQEAQECRNWGVQFSLFNFSAVAQTIPQFITLFGNYRQPLPNQHPYGATNDPLEIQFGAIFPPSTTQSHERAAFFNKDHRRILISCGADNGYQNGVGTAHHLGRVPGSPVGRSLTFSAAPIRSSTAHGSLKNPNLNVHLHSREAVILGAYRQLLGGSVYAGQRLTASEVKLNSGEITLREFIRQVAKSRLFRQQCWESLYITKAIEHIHRRLLGRPTYGREELSRYYDLCAKQGFYALVDALVDSAEYSEVFGEDRVPYERYVTPQGLMLRTPTGTGEAWHNGFAGSTRRPAESIPSTVPATQVSEGGNAWAWMMQQASRRSGNGYHPPLPNSTTTVVVQMMEQSWHENNPESTPEAEGQEPPVPV
jgi:phycobilisome core-membrane linker protein